MPVSRRVAATVLLIFVSSLFLTPKVLPNLHAATTAGEVCITLSTTATRCPTSPPTLGSLTVGSTFEVGVFIQGSDAMGGFDIYVASDPTYLNPTAAVLGPLIANPILTSICINGAPTTGECTVGTANSVGVVEVTTIDGTGSNECGGISPCSGMAFTITYSVVAGPPALPTGTSISYPSAPGCSPSSLGTTTVCVLVDDAFGNTLSEDTQGATVTQTATPLAGDFSYNPPSPQAGIGVSFYGVASGGRPPYTYSWTFGDGATASGSTVNHTYSAAGSYSVVLTVNDSDSPRQTASTQATLTVANLPPPPPQPLAAGFIFSPSSPQTGQQISFSSSISGGVPPYQSLWSFGDGSQAAGPSALHTYSFPGSYTISLYVSDSGSPRQIASSQQPITVTGPPPPPSPSGYVLSWQGFDWDGGHEETAYLNGVAAASLPLIDVPGNGGTWASFSLNITSFLVQGTNLLTFAHAGWDCGITDNVRNLSITNGTSVYSNSASLPLSCAQSLTYAFTIGTAPSPPSPPPPLTLTEFFHTANPVVGEACSFTAFASGGVPPYSFSWDFGDNVTSFGSSVTHIYPAPGTYAVTLTVRDSASPSSNTLSLTGYQTVSTPPPPSAGTYTLSWEGYDWDGGGEETIALNGQIITTLPGIDTPSNGGGWAPFFLNVTSYMVSGTNTLTFTHASWDCSVSDNVRNLQVTSGTTVIYSNQNESSLSCTQTLTYTFTL